MADLEATAGLDISDALASVDSLSDAVSTSLDAAFEAALTNFSTAISDAVSETPEITIEADTSAIVPEIESSIAEAEGTVPVDADTSAAEDQLQTFAAEAESTSATVTVEADTEAAEEAVASLNDELSVTGTAGEQAGSGLEKTASGATIVGGASAVASGQLGGVSRVLEGLGPVGARVAGGLGGLGLGIGVIASKGLEATAVLQRFDTIVGDMASEILDLRVGDLNTDLDTLAIKLGSDDEALRDASASIFQFGVNSGASREEAATFTNQVDALAARAVALNPALGDVGSVAQAMIGAFASGRDRALIPFQIALDKTQVSSRALQIATEDGRDEVTRFDTATAVAQLSVERYGNTLNTTVASGAQNAEIRQRSLKESLDNIFEAAGKPIVVPLLDLLEESQPAVEVFATSLSQVAVSALPLLTAGMQAAVPVLEALGFVLETVTDLTEEAGTTSIVAGGAIGFAFGGPLGAVIGVTAGAIAGLTDAFDDSSESADQYRIRLKELAGELQGLGPKAAATKFDLSNIEAGKLTVDQTIKSLRDLAAVSPATAKIVVDGYEKQAESQRAQGVTTQFTEAAYGRLRAAVEKGTVVFIDNAQKSKEVALADRALAEGHDVVADSYVTPTQAAIDFVTALQDEQRLLEELENRLLGVPGALNNVAQAQQSQTEAQRKVNEAIRDHGLDSDETRDAVLRLEDANLRVATSVIGLDKAQREASETVGRQSVPALDAEIARLEGLIATNPAAAASLQPIIDQLITQRDLLNFLASLGSVNVTVNAETARAEEDLRRLIGLLGVASAADVGFFQFATGAATGEVVRATPGGVMRRVAEGGYDEVIVPTNDPLRAAELLVQGGLGQLLAPKPVASVHAPQGGGSVDNSITIEHIDASGQRDPVRQTLAVVRKLRTEQFLRGWS